MLTWTQYCNPRNFIHIRYQLSFILINIVISGLLMYYPNTFFSTADPEAKIYPLTPEAARLIGITSRSIIVETGMYLEDFHTFDLTNNEFVITASVWFKFDPAVISLETVGQFSFDRGEILSKSPPSTKFIDKLLFVEYRVKLRFISPLTHRLFPVEDHRIHITLTNKKVSPRELVFTASESGFTLSPDIVVAGWDKVRRSVVTGYTQTQLERNDPKTIAYYPVAVFALDFVRSGLRQIFVLSLPLFLIFFLGIVTLSLDPSKFATLRISISIANLTALIGYRFIIENMSPKAGYFMLSDHIFNLFFALTFVIFFFHIATIKQASEFIRGLLAAALHMIFLASWYYLLVIWVQHH